jgi:RNA-directed DNA polymerase
VAQTVVAARIEAVAEQFFHPDSYGYRPGKSALDAVDRARKRCWRYDWVIDLDVRKFFDSVPWDLIARAVAALRLPPWVLLYVKRWLAAPVIMPGGQQAERDRGTPQGSLCSAEHNEPYAQCRVMRSVGLLGLVGAGSASGHCA